MPRAQPAWIDRTRKALPYVAWALMGAALALLFWRTSNQATVPTGEAGAILHR